jgi:hypothetical protein
MKNLLQSGEPAFALTGPVARGDIGTVRSHLRLLDRESPRWRAYRASASRRSRWPRRASTTSRWRRCGVAGPGAAVRRRRRPRHAPGRRRSPPPGTGRPAPDRRPDHRRGARRCATSAPLGLVPHGRAARRAPEPGGGGQARCAGRASVREPTQFGAAGLRQHPRDEAATCASGGGGRRGRLAAGRRRDVPEASPPTHVGGASPRA